MAENQLEGEALGVSWDGTGYGVDGTIWGGEFLLINNVSFKRVATFRSFRLPGGEKAIKEPRRTALGLLFEMLGDSLFEQNNIESLKSFTHMELEVIHQMLLKGVNSPITTSAGRLFDAVASLIGLRQHMNFEGQAAMELEFLTTQIEAEESKRIGNYRFEMGVKEISPISNLQSPIIIDWSPMISEIMIDQKKKILHPLISVKFHNTLAEMIIAVAKHIGQQRVVLSGGCFQNRYLTERAVQRLQEEGFRPYWHQRVPPNDGGISLGQMYAVLHKRGKKET
jgi:hydrogenase maturation protein HypF